MGRVRVSFRVRCKIRLMFRVSVRVTGKSISRVRGNVRVGLESESWLA